MLNKLNGRRVAVSLLVGAMVATASAEELEVQFTGTLTSVGGVPGASVGDTLAGSLELDLGALLPTTTTNGTTFSSASLSTLAADPSPAHSALAISGGASVSTGNAGFNHIAVMTLYRNATTGGFNFYSLLSADLEVPPGLGGASISLSVSDLLGSQSAIFSTPPGDLSLMQPIDWFPAGATTSGMFALGDGGGAFDITSLHVGPVAAVPEPATLPLLVAGLCGIGVVARRRRRDPHRSTRAS